MPKREPPNEKNGLEARDSSHGIPKEFIDDLDVDLIEEIKEQFPEENGEEPGTYGPPKAPSLWKITAAVVFLSFLLLVLSGWLKIFTLPSLDFLARSRDLQKSTEIQTLQKSVVRIEVREKSAISSLRRSGTGFNISPQGLIITNRHVVEGAGAVFVSFPGAGEFVGTDWIIDQESDLAVIDINAGGLPTLEMTAGDFSPSPGSRVVIIGNPLGFNSVVVEGEVLEYAEGSSTSISLMVIAAPIHPGSSGSPVITETGKVAAVIFASVGREKNIKGLAIPSDRILDFLKESESIFVEGYR